MTNVIAFPRPGDDVLDLDEVAVAGVDLFEVSVKLAVDIDNGNFTVAQGLDLVASFDRFCLLLSTVGALHLDDEGRIAFDEFVVRTTIRTLILACVVRLYRRARNERRPRREIAQLDVAMAQLARPICGLTFTPPTQN